MRAWFSLTVSFVLAFAAGVVGCEGTGIGTRDCSEAKTADQCANAKNEEEGGGCSWLPGFDMCESLDDVPCSCWCEP